MPAPVFDKSYFHPTFLDLFWQLLTERMKVYWRREAGDPPPWTNDPILRNEFITNVYRELDPGTTYLQNRVLHDETLDDGTKVFNIMIYRLLGSKVEFHEHLDIYDPVSFNGTEFADACKAVEENQRIGPFGEAYRTAAYSDMGSKEKIVNVGLLLEQLAEGIPQLLQDIQSANTLEQVFRVLESTRGFGEFLAYQIMVDLMYPAPFEPLIPHDENEWAMAGPGARRGIWQMLTPGMKPSSMLEVMTWLRDHQHEEFERLGLDFPFLLDMDDNPIPISLCNIQASLCEYYKYARIWKGEAKAVRKYFYSEPQVALINEPSEITVSKPTESTAPVVQPDLIEIGNTGSDGFDSISKFPEEVGVAVDRDVASTEQRSGEPTGMIVINVQIHVHPPANWQVVANGTPNNLDH